VAPFRNGSVGERMAEAGPGGGEPREEVGERPGMDEREDAVEIIEEERGRPRELVVSIEIGWELGDILYVWKTVK